MSKLANTLEFKIERTIPAAPAEVYDAWLDPKVPGTPWNEADRLILNPTIDGFFYWLIRETAHYGRFTRLDRGACIQNTWVSPNTLGHETTVTVTFEKKGNETLMTLVHANLPDDDKARSHEKGWNYFLGNFSAQFGTK
ncbi:MAG: SRPBCC family protein [Candidatus Eiseniibacteriota bacterium]